MGRILTLHQHFHFINIIISRVKSWAAAVTRIRECPYSKVKQLYYIADTSVTAADISAILIKSAVAPPATTWLATRPVMY